MPEHLKFTAIGAGAMAEAIIGGLLRNSVFSADKIIAAEPLEKRRQYIQSTYQVQVSADNGVAASQADVILLSVKPQFLPEVFSDLKGKIPSGALVLSIVAGVSLQSLQDGLGHVNIIRCMPNTPAQVGAGMTVWTASQQVSDKQKELTATVLASLGAERYVEDEKYIDMATAVSGSGPAYVFLFIEALIDAGVQIGMNREMAEQLAAQTVMGSCEYYIQKGVHAAQLRNQVTSPAGTTAAALYQLEKNGLRNAISDAVLAAYHRSIELGKS